ncbi:MAG: ATP-binding cassette domain-containing protein, partial [Leptolyngbyaceae bacterium]|nr:ATP-binding cassette domain-containing protein [Leptolyngbyaceae bacterium]
MQLNSNYPVVEVINLTKTFKGGKQALQQVSFDVHAGEMLALVGASGSGKSTLLRTLNGLQDTNAGSIKVFGSTLQSDGQLHSKVRVLRSQVGFIFQQFNLVNRLTVLENVLIGALSNVSLFRSAFHLFTQEEKKRALSALERVGILEQAYKRAS